MQEDSSLNIFKQKYSKIADEKGIVGGQRIKIFKKAFDILIDFLLPDLSDMFYL